MNLFSRWVFFHRENRQQELSVTSEKLSWQWICFRLDYLSLAKLLEEIIQFNCNTIWQNLQHLRWKIFYTYNQIMQLWCECHGCFHSTLWILSREYLLLSCRLWHHLMWRGKYYLLLSILWSRKLSEIHWFLLIFSLKMEPWTELSFFHRLNIMIAMELSRVLKGWWSFSSSLSLELW